MPRALAVNIKSNRVFTQMVRRLPAISPVMGCPHGTLGLC